MAPHSSPMPGRLRTEGSLSQGPTLGARLGEVLELALLSACLSAALVAAVVVPLADLLFDLMGRSLVLDLGGRRSFAVRLLFDGTSWARASGVVVMVGVGSWVAYRLCRRYLGPKFVRSLLLLDDGAPTPSKMRRRASLPELRPLTGFGDPLDIAADDEWSSGEEEERVDSRATDATWLPFETTEVGSHLAALLDDQRPSQGLADISSLDRSPKTPSRLRPRLPPSPLVTGTSSPVFHRKPRLASTPDRLKCCQEASPSHSRATPTARRSPAHGLLRKPRFKTSALDLGEAARAIASEDDSSDGPWSTVSPPPIRRLPKDVLRATEESSLDGLPPRSGSVASRTSAAPSLWEEPLFQPVSGEDQLSESEALRIILGPKGSLELRSSPAPSEISLPVENLLLGEETSSSLAQLQGHISSVMQDSAELSQDLGMLASRLGDCRDMYRSVTVGGSELGSEASFDLGLRSTSASPAPSRASGSFRLPAPARVGGLESLLPGASPLRPSALSFASSPARRATAAPQAHRATSSSEPEETHSSPNIDQQTKELSPTPSGQRMKSSLVDSAIWTDPGSASDTSEVPADPKQAFASLRAREPALQVTPEDPAESAASPHRQLGKASPPGSLAPSELSLEWDLPVTQADGDLAHEPQPGGSRAPCDSPSSSPAGLMDLGEYARERFSDQPAAAKVLRQLSAKAGLRSVSLCLEGRTVFPAPAAVLSGVALSGGDVFKCASFGAVEEALKASARRYPFLAQWPLHTALLSPSEDMVERLRGCLRSLWAVHERSRSGDAAGAVELLGEPMTQCEAVEGLKLLMWLRAVDVYEEVAYTRQPPRPFYAALFRRCPPAVLMASLGDAALTRHFTDPELALLADTLGLRLEVFRLFSESPGVGAVYPDREPAAASLTLLQPSPKTFLPLSTATPTP